MLNHCMLDLETWGTRPGCAIRSIGAVMFDPDSDALCESYYLNVDDCVGTKDAETVRWWNSQSEEAKSFFESPLPVKLEVATERFTTWFKNRDAVYIWSHGAAFDVPIYASRVTTVPWDYRDIRDTRTLYSIAGFDCATVPFIGTKHHAAWDAIYQAKCVQAAMRKLRNVV